MADQIDCDLDNLVRRCIAQAGRAPQARKNWFVIAQQIEAIRGPVRQRMHEADLKVTT